MSLSSSIDRAVKAYADHTDAVISGDHTLDVSGLLNPFNQITQFAQQFNPAFFNQYTNGQAAVASMEGPALTTGKKKRAYKQRDANAPKRPLTAYFRFLKEQRPIITSENAETPGGEGGKAGDISKIATERWKALTDFQRMPYKQAYQHELEQYERDTKAYKEGLAVGVKLGAEDEDELMATPSAGPSRVVAKADDEEEDEDAEGSDESTSSEDASSDDESDEEVPAKAPSPPAKKAKSAKKAVTAAADPAPSQQMFSSLNPVGAAPTSSAASKKRKASDDDGDKSKKRGRPTKAEQEAAAAASQLLEESTADVKKEKKKEKKEKKRKSEAAA